MPKVANSNCAVTPEKILPAPPCPDDWTIETWLADLRTNGGEVTTQDGKMWIGSTDIAGHTIRHFASQIVGYPERRAALLALLTKGAAQ